MPHPRDKLLSCYCCWKSSIMFSKQRDAWCCVSVFVCACIVVCSRVGERRHAEDFVWFTFTGRNFFFLSKCNEILLRRKRQHLFWVVLWVFSVWLEGNAAPVIFARHVIFFFFCAHQTFSSEAELRDGGRQGSDIIQETLNQQSVMWIHQLWSHILTALIHRYWWLATVYVTSTLY